MPSRFVVFLSFNFQTCLRKCLAVCKIYLGLVKSTRHRLHRKRRRFDLDRPFHATLGSVNNSMLRFQAIPVSPPQPYLRYGKSEHKPRGVLASIYQICFWYSSSIALLLCLVLQTRSPNNIIF